MRRFSAFAVTLVLLIGLVIPSAAAGNRDQAITARVGMPTDVMFNTSANATYDMYVYGLAVEGAYGIQMNNWLILGGVAGYGFGKAEEGQPFGYRHYTWAGARVGFGRLEGFSGSLIGGVVYAGGTAYTIIPDIGLTLDWKFLSLGLTTGCVSLGATLGI